MNNICIVTSFGAAVAVFTENNRIKPILDYDYSDKIDQRLSWESYNENVPITEFKDQYVKPTVLSIKILFSKFTKNLSSVTLDIEETHALMKEIDKYQNSNMRHFTPEEVHRYHFEFFTELPF